MEEFRINNRYRTENFGAIMYTSLSSNLYSSLADVCREYIANEIDEFIKIPNGRKHPKIEISFTYVQEDEEKKIRDIQILGNGPGMNIKDLNNSLLNLGTSVKRTDRKTIGNYGLGLHAGTLVCKKIMFETKKVGMDVVANAEMPVEKWLQNAEENPNLLLNDLLEGKIGFRDLEETESVDKSFTKIILKGLKGDYANLAQIINLKENLCLILPIKMEETEASKVYNDTLNDLYQSAEASRPFIISLFIDGEEMVRPFQVPLEYPPIYGVIPSKARGKRILAVYWVGFHSKALKPEIFRGVDIFQNGIAVIRAENWKQELKLLGKQASHWNAYPRLKMDVHVIRGNIKPRAQRDRFDYSNDWNTVLDEVFSIFKERMRMAYTLTQSNVSSDTIKFKQSVQNQLKSLNRTPNGRILIKSLEEGLTKINWVANNKKAMVSKEKKLEKVLKSLVKDKNQKVHAYRIKTWFNTIENNYKRYVSETELQNLSYNYIYIIENMLRDLLSSLYLSISNIEFDLDFTENKVFKIPNSIQKELINRDVLIETEDKAILLNLDDIIIIIENNSSLFKTLFNKNQLYELLELLESINSYRLKLINSVTLTSDEFIELNDNYIQFLSLLKIIN